MDEYNMNDQNYRQRPAREYIPEFNNQNYTSPYKVRNPKIGEENFYFQTND